MRPTRFQRPPKRTKTRLSARDGYRAALAGLLLVFVLAATFSDGGLLSAVSKPGARAKTSGQQRQLPAIGEYGDDELRTGSILFVPSQGNICRQKLIDNATWRIWDNGPVVCDEAVSWNAAHGSRFTGTRIDAIRDGFFPAKR